MKKAALITLFIIGNLYAQNIGVINVDSVMLFLPEYTRAQRQIDSTICSFHQKFKNALEEYNSALNICAIGWDLTNTKSYQKKIDSLQQLILTAQKSLEDSMVLEQTNLMKKVKDQLKIKVYFFCQKNNISLLVDRSYLVHNDLMDYTNELITYIKADYSK